MYLYSLVGAGAHKDPEYGLFTPDESGAFPFPDDVSDVLVTCAVRGRKLWETEEARAERMHGMELARRRDPASVLSAIEDNAALVKQLAAVTAQLAAMQLAQAGGSAPAVPVPQPETAAGVTPGVEASGDAVQAKHAARPKAAAAKTPRAAA